MTRRLARAWLTAAAVVAAVYAWPAAADTATPVDPPPSWGSLTASQQAALAPLQRDWPTIDAPRKQKWIEIASRFPTMPPAERQRVQERMAEWARMTPAQRGSARLQFQETRQFSPEDRQARWEAYQALPDDERRALAQKATPPGKPASAPPPKVITDVKAKNNVLSPQRPDSAKPVSPTIVQAKPGATTTLMSATPAPRIQPQAGLPKIAATEGFVDKNTLLPTRGPQGAAVHGSAASAPAAQP